MRDQRLARQYLLELFGSSTVYIVLLVSSLFLAKAMQPSVARLLVLLSPMLGFGLMLWMLVRQYRRMDEFLRRILLENCAIAAGITAALTFTYGFLEGVGYPRLSMFTVWALLGASWGLTAIVRSVFDR
ncbi:hypothetical protein [Thermomonas sp.]|uniref:hypothetical protein n=1 Tax=Thermomonas sp. TaxID=1971895 RepID=UPI00248A5EF0|nr:hypothetical protein [Thermomonas sp.]MDI1253023.1 hypothetical protein [Thermomonas sp.]